MDARRLALEFHALLHAGSLGAGDRSWQDGLLRKLDERQLRARPAGMNPLAWLLWHTSRIEDVAVNAVLRDRPPVFEQGEWENALGMPGLAGTGMSDEEVGGFAAAVDIAGLLAYRLAVGRSTREWIQSVRFESDLAEMPPVRSRLAANASAVFDDRSDWVIAFWESFGEPISFVGLPIVGHQMAHIGEGRVVRALVTGKRGR